MIRAIYSASSHIHCLAAKIPLDDAEYRNMLYDLYGKRSSKQLTDCQQLEFIKLLQKQIRIKHGSKWSGFKRKNPDMATPKQLSACEAMWKTVSRAATPEAREAALHKFCKRITGVERLEWLTKTNIRKLFKAMEKMGAATPEQYNKTIGG